MNIIDEAVEAAKVAFDETNGGLFEDEYAYNVARQVLEAAAPHLMAQAWDEGERSGYANSVALEYGLRQSPNPYRSAGVGE